MSHRLATCMGGKVNTAQFINANHFFIDYRKLFVFIENSFSDIVLYYL